MNDLATRLKDALDAAVPDEITCNYYPHWPASNAITFIVFTPRQGSVMVQTENHPHSDILRSVGEALIAAATPAQRGSEEVQE